MLSMTLLQVVSVVVLLSEPNSIKRGAWAESLKELKFFYVCFPYHYKLGINIICYYLTIYDKRIKFKNHISIMKLHLQTLKYSSPILLTNRPCGVKNNGILITLAYRNFVLADSGQAH